MSRNEHTGASIQTKPATDNYRNNFDNIFRKTKQEILKGCSNESCFCTGECKLPVEEFTMEDFKDDTQTSKE